MTTTRCWPLVLVLVSLVIASCDGAQPTPTLTASVPITGIALPNLAKVADPPGGHISDITFAPSDPQIVYLASNVNAMGVWRSDNGGETWGRVYYDDEFGATHVNTVVVHPTNPNIVLLSDLHGRIVKTSDGGLEWREVYEEDVSIFALAISPSAPNVVYAGDQQNNLLKSINTGDTWTRLSQVGSKGVGALTVDPSTPDTVYAGARDGVYKSTDGGVVWHKVVSEVQVVEVAMGPADPDLVLAATRQGVFRSTNGGTSWQQSLDIHAHSVQVAPSNPRVFYAGTAEGVYQSDDRGDTWINSSSGIEYLDIGPIAIHPQSPDVAIVGNNIWQWTFHNDPFPDSTSGEGIYKTVDGGTSWLKTTEGFIDVDVVALAVDPHDPNVAYVGMECSRGIFRTEDGGATWVFIAGGPESSDRVTRWDIGHYTMRLATSPDSTLYLTGRFGITKSVDRGDTWEPMLVRRHFHGVRAAPGDSRVVFTGTSPSQDPTETAEYPGAHILRSLDGGDTWEEVGAGFPSGAHTSIHDFAFDPANLNIVYVTTSSHEIGLPRTQTTVGIYKSIDGGQTWTAINEGLTTKEVDSLVVSPNPPKDTDGRREDSGRGWVRELQGRWPGVLG